MRADRPSGGAAQLTALAALHRQFSQHDIPYWLFGGWAVDFHVGRVTRSHDDIDIAVRSADADRVDELLGQTGWVVVGGTEGYRTYRSGDVQLDVAWVGDGDAGWPEDAFGHETGELGGYRISVVGRAAMVVDKSAGLGDPAKDLRDAAALRGAGTEPHRSRS
jgi:hypothetical protein